VTGVAALDVGALADVAGPRVRGLLARVEERLLALSGSAGPVLSPYARGTIAAGGKRLRPLLVLIAAGPAPPEADAGLVRAAVAVELVHGATLVHDDVLDAATLRRGQPTVAAAAGRDVALATGDLLFARAFAELSAGGSAAQVTVLSEASSALARGELMQRHDAFDATVSVQRYLARCELKTARLFEAACALGALAAQTDGDADGDRDVAALTSFGRSVGLAFQILDDVLDVTGPAQRTGKQPGADLLDGTVTLPFILACESDPQLAALDPRTITTPQRAAEVCEQIAATDALGRSRERALELVDAAKARLPATLDGGRRRALELVADGVVLRYA
jgi:geranylgeranyl pyrophosphate synthase